MQIYKVQLIKKEVISEDILFLEFTRPEKFEFKAGQYILIKLMEENTVKWRAYSIFSAPKEKTKIDLCIKIVPDGLASTNIANAEINSEFEIKGPAGELVLAKDDKKEHYFLAAGSGIAPFYSMIKEHAEDKISLFFSAKTQKQLIKNDELNELQNKNKNFKYYPTLTQENWGGLRGRIIEHLSENITDKIFYLCGLKEFVLETEVYLLSKGVTKENIKKERYS
ncbi:MAG: FAD-dependent oxidoreductase [Candidatus Woesearchaeota archaeon]